ncbi:MAG: HU family DNA-binding protein [Thermodesulfobacteriota bacterium]
MSQPCAFCNGSGQISYFKGVSRFLLSEEECPECGGTGIAPVAQAVMTHAVAVDAELQRAITTCSGLSPEQAELFLTTLADQLTAVLSRGEVIRLRGFGSFMPTGIKPSMVSIGFRPGRRLRDTINENGKTPSV